MRNFEFIGFSDPVSSLSHLAGALVFLIIGIVSLVKYHQNWRHSVAMGLFVFAVIFSLSMSGVYHLLTPDTTGRIVLQRLDHAAIFFLIAASFTPIHALLFRGFNAWGVLMLIWIISITGITLKTIFFNDMPEWLGLVFYLGLGWVGIYTAVLLIRNYGLSFTKFLFLSAIAYTVGAVLDYEKSPILINHVIGAHEIFHFCVLAGIAFHWRFLFHRVYPHLIPETASDDPSLNQLDKIGTIGQLER